MVGRGLRLHPEKTQLNLIDCVGVTGRLSPCTAPSLLGVDMSNVPEKKRDEVQGELFDLPLKAASATDCPESWIKNIQIVDLWARGNSYNTHNVNWFRMPDGSMVCSLTKDPETGQRRRLVIPPPDALGRVRLGNDLVDTQTAFDRAYTALRTRFGDEAYIWDINQVKKWGAKPASEKQIAQVKRMFPTFQTDGLTKQEASQILNRMFNR
jgi:hypothetical protein